MQFRCPMDLTGRRILVTGASSGIGRTTAVLLSRLNATVILGGRSQERLTETMNQMEGRGHASSPFDLCSLNDIDNWVRQCTEAYGPLAGLVHSAGIQATVPLRVLSAKRLESMMQINVSVAAMLSKAMLQRGCCQPRPSIVFLSSVSGLVGDSGLAAYSASKSALIGLCRSLAIELAPSGTRVNCVVPGLVRSEMASRMEGSISSDRMADVVAKHPLGIGEPLDVAQAIAFLLADSSKWITGTALVVDGGYTAR